MEPVHRAIIDVGTNSVKLLVAAVSGFTVDPLFETSEQTRLGSGFYEAHRLQSAAIAHTAQVIAGFAEKARHYQAETIRVIATSAARDAQNQHELVEAIRGSSGLQVEIISGEQEAEWVFRGVSSDPKLHDQPLLILDVGGGSTECILGEHDHYSFRRSFDMGSVRLLERLRPGDPPSPEDRARCREWIKEFLTRQIGPALDSFLHEETRRHLKLVGTGGTSTILARMFHQMNEHDRVRIESTRLSRPRVLEFLDHLWSLPLAERRQVPGLPPNRADVILMGVAIYQGVMEYFRLDELCVSMRGLRFGAVIKDP